MWVVTKFSKKSLTWALNHKNGTKISLETFILRALVPAWACAYKRKEKIPWLWRELSPHATCAGHDAAPVSKLFLSVSVWADHSQVTTTFHFEFHYGKKKLTNQPCPFSDENYENSYLFPLLDRVFNFFECLKSFGVSIPMKATKFFGMELFAFRQFSKTKTWRFCWTSWLLGTARNQRLRPQRLIDYYLHSYLCVTLRSVFLWFC